MADEPMISAAGIRKAFRSARVLDGIDLRVPAGTVHALLGPNGAGKTTMVRILSTLLRPDGGTARVAGHDVVRSPGRVRAAISLTGQSAAVDELLTGEENLVMMGRLRRLGAAAARSRAAALLDRFDLADARRRRVKEYSGGMRRRLDLALSLVVPTPVIFLDEPTTGLDPRSRQAMWDAVRHLVDGGTTVLLTTQYLEEADRLADRITVLDGGRIVADGTPEQLKTAVPGEQVELLFADDAALARGSAALDGRAVRIDRQRRAVAVGTDGSAAAVKDLLDRMAAQRVAVDRLALHRPSLDDVFLALTGHGAGPGHGAGAGHGGDPR